MQITKPSVQILSYTEDALTLIEEAGRTCYKSEQQGDPEAFVQMLIKRGHESVLEHASVTVRIVCDRGVSHELVRHRIASYSQESTRYCNYAKKGVEFIKPTFKSAEAEIAWHEAMEKAELLYVILLDLGEPPQIARSVLPNSLKTEIVVTMNIREWRHFLKLRTASAAHPQMREIAWMCTEKLNQIIPVVFEEWMNNDATRI